MRKLTLLLVTFLGFYGAESQQLHFTSQYLQHNAMYNPAAAGIANKNMVGISYRSQWSSFPGNPKTFMIYSDFALEKLNAGVGAYAYRDETGPTSRTGIQLAYSYHIKSRNEKNKFGLGLELRGLQYAIDKSKLNASLGNDPLLAGSSNKLGIDAGAGAYFTNGKLSVGAAVSQLIQSKLELSNIPNAKESGKLYRHYNFTANYKWQTGDDIYLIPNAMVRLIEHAPSEYEFGMLANYQDKLWWGLGWRIDQFWTLQAGFRILDKVALTYSYDYYNTPINVFTAGSGAHEIGMRFDFKK
ncbi:type IX secretion system membrane protein PorP/SprF [Ferruginibacter sp. HRS2-29]|uniref:PorP/SprF family type IX secretion system membrane protein n=1 Tax=Ferruginibacter sp. HRS2-29 TaxID=2487334 RepID=UPI0020CF75EE|nr:type IX secretion system membrane protein PorP/SprF [Ferruginibacter sp. HRS2-29]MCP9753243.1 type IX secretion system membrane protein PorP/SprF [Ferruginibacter sp. HRS2-29]